MMAKAIDKQSANNSGIVIALISTCHGLSHFYQLVVPSLYLFMAPEMSLSYSDLGLYLVVFSAISMIGQPISGIIVDRIGGATTLVIGTLIYSSAIALSGISQGLLPLISAAILAGLGNGVYHPSDLSIINHKIKHTKLPLAYSFHVIGGQIGWGLAPVTMVLLANLLDWRTALILASLPGFILSAIVFIYRKQLHCEANTKVKTEAMSIQKQSLVSMLSTPWILMMLIFFAMHSVATMPIPQFGQIIFFNLMQLPKELVASYISLFIALSSIGAISGGLILSKKVANETVHANNSRQFTHASFVILVSMFIASISYAVMAFIPASMLLSVLAVAGFCIGMAAPPRDSMVRIMAHGENQGKAYGIVYSGIDIGMLFAPAIIGSLIDNQMSYATLMIPATACLVAAFITLMCKKGSKIQANELPI